MAERHADELSLLAYVDDELEAGDRRALEQHLETCPECAAQARSLVAGRDALRNAPLLELSEERRRAIVASLPEREKRESFFAPLLRRGPALAAAAALVLVAGVVALATQIDGGGRDERGGAGEAGGAALEEATQDEAGAAGGDTGAQEAQKDFRAAGPPVRRVEGPADEVVRLLRKNGVDASVEDGAVVATADQAEVRRILVARPRGDVPVYVR
jgi:Putative zinc-finger